MGQGSDRLPRVVEPERVPCREEVGRTVGVNSAVNTMAWTTLTEGFLPPVSP